MGRGDNPMVARPPAQAEERNPPRHTEDDGSHRNRSHARHPTSGLRTARRGDPEYVPEIYTTAGAGGSRTVALWSSSSARGTLVDVRVRPLLALSCAPWRRSAAPPAGAQLRRPGRVKPCGAALGGGAPRRLIAPPPASFATGGSLTAGSTLRGRNAAVMLRALARSPGLSLVATSSRFLPASSSPCAAAAENHA